MHVDGEGVGEIELDEPQRVVRPRPLPDDSVSLTPVEAGGQLYLVTETLYDRIVSQVDRSTLALTDRSTRPHPGYDYSQIGVLRDRIIAVDAHDSVLTWDWYSSDLGTVVSGTADLTPPASPMDIAYFSIMSIASLPDAIVIAGDSGFDTYFVVLGCAG